MKRGEKNRDLKERCKAYIRKTRSFPEAQALAKKDGVSANVSVWLSAFAETLTDTMVEFRKLRDKKCPSRKP